MGHDVGKQGKGTQTDIRGAGTRRSHTKRKHQPKQTNTVHGEHFEGKREPHPYNTQASPRPYPDATNSAPVRHPGRASSGRRRSPARTGREMLLGPAPKPAPPHPYSRTAWVFQHTTRVALLTDAHPSFPHPPHPLRPARPICFGFSLCLLLPPAPWIFSGSLRLPDAPPSGPASSTQTGVPGDSVLAWAKR
jgi:hypothetical protein